MLCQDCGTAVDEKSGQASSQEARSAPVREYESKTYTPLPSKRGYIRLLKLRGSAPDTPDVECELEVEKFQSCNSIRKYEALSWCWGTKRPSGYININKGGKLYAKYVSPELVAALKALRFPVDARYLWIDAICIDQTNDQEKNHQVEMMAEIYGRAHRVCIWLGQGDKSSRMALRFIKKEVLQLQNFDELCESEKASEKWGALLALMQRPWFSRRWVVQEIALARKAIVYCGADKISWKKFAVAVELFVEVETATHRLSEVMKKDPKFYHVPGWFEYVSALGASLLVEATGKLFRDYKPNGPGGYDSDTHSESESSPESDFETDSDFGSISSDKKSELVPETSAGGLPPSSRSGSRSLPDTRADAEDETRMSSEIAEYTRSQPLLSLEYLVSSLSIFEATDQHDIIYALLAIAKDTTPSASDEEAQLLLDHTQDVLEIFTQKKRYKVEYEANFVDVCKDFVKFCIEHSDQSRALDIMCRPWAPEPEEAILNNNSPRRKKVRKRKTRKPSDLSNKEDTEGSKKDGEGKQKKPTAKSGLKERKKQKEENLPLPSWIPRLSGAAYAMYSQAGVHELKMGRKNADTLVGLPPSHQSLQRNYNAAQTKVIDTKTLRFRRRSKSGHYSLYVTGFILDVVKEVQPSSQGGAIPREWAQAAEWQGVPESDPPDEFWRTLVADRGRDGRNPPVYYSRACKESFVKGGLSSGSVNTTDLINNERCTIVAQFCRRVQAVIWNRSLLKTKNTKRLGLGNQNVQVGDVVCILYGCSVPVILRCKEKQQLQIDQEIEEDKAHWRYDVATRVTRNRRRIRSFQKNIAEEKERYKKWEKKMKAEWHRVCQESEREEQREENGRRDYTSGASPDSTHKTPSETGSIGAAESFNIGNQQREEGDSGGVLGANHSDRDETDHPLFSTPLGTPNKIINDENDLPGLEADPLIGGDPEVGSAPPFFQPSPTPSITLPLEDSTSKKNEHHEQLQVRALELIWKEAKPTQQEQDNKNLKCNEYILWRAATTKTKIQEIMAAELQTLQSKAYTAWILKKREIAETEDDKEEEERLEREAFKDWLKVKREMAKKEKKYWDEPKVNWQEFELLLKYGRRWKKLLRTRRDRRELFARLRIEMARKERARLQDQPEPEDSKILKKLRKPREKKKYENFSAAYEETLDTKFRDKYQERAFEEKRSKREKEAASDKKSDDEESVKEHNKRVQDNRHYYEFLGECYIHGMMDGEAMAYQNSMQLRKQVFELR